MHVGTKLERLTHAKRVDLLGRCRAARALVLSDAESFDEASRVLEYAGQLIDGKVKFGLGHYEDAVVALALESGRHEDGHVRRLFAVIREARNKAVHEGAWARHLASRLVDLLLIIEEELVRRLHHVEDLMVRSPLVAEQWHLLCHVRKMMLESSFSYLPTYTEQGKWVLISDFELMHFLSARVTEKDADSTSVSEAIDSGELKAIEPEVCVQGALVHDVFERIDNCPMLVFDSDGGHLVGILTAFDLL